MKRRLTALITAAATVLSSAAITAEAYSVKIGSSTLSYETTDDYEELLTEEPDSGASPEASVTLMMSVQALGAPDSEIILRRYYFGQSSKEIGAALGLAPNTVDQKLSSQKRDR